MDIAKLLKPPTNYDSSNIHSLAEENDRLRRLLASTARTYNTTKQELDSAREALGYNNSHLPFLQLPREVRDQIYRYALRADLNVTTEPRDIADLSNADPLQTKPSSPSICLTNKQIHREANEIMYGENQFSFPTPGVMLRFEGQIGDRNRKLVRKINITCNLDTTPGKTIDPYFVAPCDLLPFPSHWVLALNKSRFCGIVEMVIFGEHNWWQEPVEVPDSLRDGIVALFGQNKESHLPPKVSLIGFGSAEVSIAKFPPTWKVTGGALRPGSDIFQDFDFDSFLHQDGEDQDGEGDFSFNPITGAFLDA